MSDGEVKVWFVHCKPFEEKERDLEPAKRFQEECIENGIFGMGWRPKGDEIKKFHGVEYSDEVAEELKRMVKAKVISNTSAFSKAQNCYKEMKEGDVVLAALNDQYFVGVIAFKPRIPGDELKSRISDYYRFTWYSEVKDGWKKVGQSIDLPHHVRGLISARKYQGTVALVEKLSADTIKKIAGIECPKKKLNKTDFLTALGPEDLEDVVADYMTQKNKGYIFLPSSCKQGTPLIEYVLYNPENGKQIACQTKVNEKIDLSVYMSGSFAKYEKIYFFSGKGYINEPEDMRNFEIIRPEDLYETLKNNAYFSEIIRQYFDFE